MYGILLPGLFLTLSYLRTNAQTSQPIAAPLNTSSFAQVKSGPLSAGGGTTVTVETSTLGIRLESSPVDYATIGFDLNQSPMPFWYSSSVDSQHVPFPLWGFTGSSAGNTVFGSAPLAINTSTAVGSSSLVLVSSGENAASVPVSFYVGGGSDGRGGITANAALVMNAVAANAPDYQNGSVFDWKWSDVNVDSPVAGLFMTDAGARGIVMTLTDPLNLDPAKSNPAVKLTDRWQEALQLDLRGNAAIGLASTTGAYAFQQQQQGCPSGTYSSRITYQDLQKGTQFYVPTWVNEINGAPGSIFSLSSSYNLNDGLCYVDQSGAETLYVYKQYAPVSNASVFANSVHMVNPTDVSGWDTMSTTSLQTLVSGITGSDNFVDPATGVKRGDMDAIKQVLYLVGIRARALEPSAVHPKTNSHTAVWGKNGGNEEGFIYNSWALCPSGYFITAVEWSQHTSGATNGVVPAIKCGRVVGW